MKISLILSSFFLLMFSVFIFLRTTVPVTGSAYCLGLTSETSIKAGFAPEYINKLFFIKYPNANYDPKTMSTEGCLAPMASERFIPIDSLVLSVGLLAFTLVYKKKPFKRT